MTPEMQVALLFAAVPVALDAIFAVMFPERRKVILGAGAVLIIGIVLGTKYAFPAKTAWNTFCLVFPVGAVSAWLYGAGVRRQRLADEMATRQDRIEQLVNSMPTKEVVAADLHGATERLQRELEQNRTELVKLITDLKGPMQIVENGAVKRIDGFFMFKSLTEVNRAVVEIIDMIRDLRGGLNPEKPPQSTDPKYRNILALSSALENLERRSRGTMDELFTSPKR